MQSIYTEVFKFLFLVIKSLCYQQAQKDTYISSILSVEHPCYRYAQKDRYLVFDFVDVIFM